MVESGIFDTMITESVKINKKILDRIRRYSKKTGQTISGYINIVLEVQIARNEETIDMLTDLPKRKKKQTHALK